MIYTFSAYTCPFLKANHIHPNYWSLLLTILTSTWIFFMILPAILNYKVNEYGSLVYQSINNNSIEEQYMKKDDERFWIATIYDTEKNEEKLVGTIALTNISEKYRAELRLPEDKKVAYIDHVGVDSEYGRNGFGKELMENAIRFAKVKNYEYVSLFVLQTSTPAINLYKKMKMNIVNRSEKIKYIGLNKIGMLIKL